MDKERLRQVLNNLLETLASIEHERWSHWQRYVHSKCSPMGDDGSRLIPGDLVQHWEEQMRTPYPQLAEVENRERPRARAQLPTAHS